MSCITHGSTAMVMVQYMQGESFIFCNVVTADLAMQYWEFMNIHRLSFP